MTMSYEQLDGWVDSVAYRLQKRGVGYGERVALICPKRWEYPVLLWALFRLRSVACPISPRFPGETVSTVLEETGCKTLIDAVGGLSGISAPVIRRLCLSDLFDTMTQERKPPEDDLCLPVPEPAGTIVLTSGSSGGPKAVLHNLSSHYWSAVGSNRNIPVTAGTRWLLSLPLYHVGGLGILFRTFLGGGAIVIPPSHTGLAEVLGTLPVTHLSLVATQLYRLLRASPDIQRQTRLSAVLVGGGPTGADRIGEAYDCGLPIRTTYGLTEMASQVTTTGANEKKHRLATSGKVLNYRQVKIDRGEILVKGETLFRGYVTADGLSLPVDERGWFRTGDLGTVDTDGYLTLLGRKDNMFISGGENIHAEEVEASFHRLPGVVEAVVVPVEDEEFGFRPVAFVRLREGKAVRREVMVRGLAKDLPRFKIPDAIWEWPQEIPAGLKPDRGHLTELARKRLRKN